MFCDLLIDKLIPVILFVVLLGPLTLLLLYFQHITALCVATDALFWFILFVLFNPQNYRLKTGTFLLDHW